MTTITKRHELRAAVFYQLQTNHCYHKQCAEYPVKTTDLPESLSYDYFRFPSFGGLYWSRVDFALPSIRAMVMCRPLQNRFTEATATLFLEEYEVLKATVKASNYLYPIVVTDTAEYQEQLSKFINTDDINFVDFRELPNIVKELEQDEP